MICGPCSKGSDVPDAIEAAILRPAEAASLTLLKKDMSIVPFPPRQAQSDFYAAKSGYKAPKQRFRRHQNHATHARGNLLF